jgi:hypothetical protein
MAFTRGAANFATHGNVPILFSQSSLAILDKEVVALDCVNQDYEWEMQNGGDILRIRDFGGFSATVRDHTVGNTITYEDVTEDYVDLVIDQFKYTAIRLDYIDEQQSDLPVMAEYGERAGISMRNTIDSFLLTTMAAGAPASNTFGGTAAGQVLTLTPDNIYDYCVEFETRLKESNAHGLGGKPYLIVPPKVEGLMRKSGQLTHATAKGDEVIKSGVVGEFGGFDVKRTTNLEYQASASGTEAYFNLLFGYKQATQFAMQFNFADQVKLTDRLADGKRTACVYGALVTLPNALGRAIVKV